MISTDQLINIIVIGLITIVFGCLLGLAVVRVVDRRLSQISINLPKITIPMGTSHASYQLSPPQDSIQPLYENFSDKTLPAPTSNAVQNASSAFQQATNTVDDIVRQQTTTVAKETGEALQQVARVVSGDRVSGDRVSTVPSVGCNTDKDCNIVYGNGLNLCRANHQCHCVKGSGQFCHYGPTYYKDPKDMTPDQLKKFKTMAEMYRMTLQDYINWLNLFAEEQDVLPPRHFANLQKIKKGLPLTVDQIPRDSIPPPMTAQEYFHQMYGYDDQLNLDTAGVQIPSNYMDYSQFETPRNLKHLDESNRLEQLNKYENREVLQTTRPKIEHDYNN